MQTLPTQGLRLNGRHPDARGCIFAMPVIERGGEVVRNIVGVGGTKGQGQPVWTGTRSYVNMRGGRALNLSVGNYVLTPFTAQPWAGQFTIMARVTIGAMSNGGCIVRFGGVMMSVRNIAGNVISVHTDNGGVVDQPLTLTVVTGKEYAAGIRWRSSDNQTTFFLDGVGEIGAFGAALTAGAFQTGVGHSSLGTDFTGTVRDVRCWDRYMPDAAFKRYYTNPNAFYTIGKAVSAPKRVGGAGSMFFPFLHPSLQGA